MSFLMPHAFPARSGPSQRSRQFHFAQTAPTVTLYMIFVGLVVAPLSPKLALILIVLHFAIRWTLLFTFARQIDEAVRSAEQAPR